MNVTENYSDETEDECETVCQVILKMQDVVTVQFWLHLHSLRFNEAHYFHYKRNERDYEKIMAYWL